MATTMLQLPPNPEGVKLLLDDQRARLVEEVGELPTRDNCITCHGRREFLWRSPDAWDQFVTYECDCLGQRALHVWLLYCGVEKSLQRATWQDLRQSHEGALLVLDYLERAERRVDYGRGLVLYGNKGVGKTLLATLLTKGLIGQGYECFFVPFHRMVDLAMDGWRDQERAMLFRRRVENATVLVLDDVGKEHLKRRDSGEKGADLETYARPVVSSLFDAVLRRRTAASKPTILTTNLEPDGLAVLYGDNILSLLLEKSQSHFFGGEDFRPSFNERDDFEVDNGLTRPIVLS